MRFQDRIIEMRKRGMRPICLWLTDVEPKDRWSVQYESGDSPATADLRFVRGLLVKVEGYDRERVEAWAMACENAGAVRVIWAVFACSGAGEFRRVQTVAMGDTEGTFNYESAD